MRCWKTNFSVSDGCPCRREIVLPVSAHPAEEHGGQYFYEKSFCRFVAAYKGDPTSCTWRISQSCHTGFGIFGIQIIHPIYWLLLNSAFTSLLNLCPSSMFQQFQAWSAAIFLAFFERFIQQALGSCQALHHGCPEAFSYSCGRINLYQVRITPQLPGPFFRSQFSSLSAITGHSQQFTRSAELRVYLFVHESCSHSGIIKGMLHMVCLNHATKAYSVFLHASFQPVLRRPGC